MQDRAKVDIIRASGFLVFYLRGRQLDREVHETEFVEGGFCDMFSDMLVVNFLTRIVRVPPRSR